MIVVHIESGLGNQMLSYCEYLALKEVNPEQDFYLETIIYEIPECAETFCQWNGYELERVFGIEQPANIRTIFSTDEWEHIIAEIRATEFWLHNWNYPVVFTDILNKHGLNLRNIRGNFEPKKKVVSGKMSNIISMFQRFKRSTCGYWLKRIYLLFFKKRYLKTFCHKELLFYHSNDDIFTGQRLSFRTIGNQIERIDKSIKNTFTFPQLCDTKNLEMASFLQKSNGVAIHARRGDMLSVNGWCYKVGYFKRAVRYIKRHVKNPMFVFFTDPGSIKWCIDNSDVFALDFSKDKVYFVDWNKGIDSYKDLQLMSLCKHAIITNSSFGWWGAYFIDNKDKITISSFAEINTTHHC